MKNKLRLFNPLLKSIEIDQFFDKLKIILDNNDLGREFYNIVSANSGIKLIDFAFIEVKKPNNREGILAERDRINVRFKNRKFRRFLNLSQVLLFSNNMELGGLSYEH